MLECLELVDDSFNTARRPRVGEQPYETMDYVKSPKKLWRYLFKSLVDYNNWMAKMMKGLLLVCLVVSLSVSLSLSMMML